MAKKLTKQVAPTQPQQKKLSEMKDYELGMELNGQHNIIHQCDAQRIQAAQNINAIVAEMEKRQCPTDTK